MGCRAPRSSGGHSRPWSKSPPFPGQLRFWNPDDLNASPGASPSPDWIEEKLQEVCEHLGITRDGHLNRKKLVSICEQYGLHAAAGEVSDHLRTRPTTVPAWALAWPPKIPPGIHHKHRWLLGKGFPGGFQLQLLVFHQAAVGEGSCQPEPWRACLLTPSLSELEFKNMAGIPSMSP